MLRDYGSDQGEIIGLLMQRNDLQDGVYVGDTQKVAGSPFIFPRYGFGRNDHFGISSAFHLCFNDTMHSRITGRTRNIVSIAKTMEVEIAWAIS